MSVIKLRDYQQEAVDLIRAEFRANNSPVLFVLPTGGGKTYTFSYIANGAAQKRNRVIIIVHRKELLTQASASLRNLGIQHGMISPHFTPDPRQIVQVASIDTLMIRLKKQLAKGELPDIFKFAMAIFDESHHVVADNKWGECWELLGRPATLGVTATPTRADGKGLGEGSGGIFKSMVLGPSVAWLIEQGMLINPVVYTSLETPDLSGLKTRKDGEYNGKQLAERVDKPRITGSAVEQYTKVCPGARAIVFCTNIQHAKNVVAEFNAAGYRFSLLVGEPEMKDSERTKVNNMLRRGELDGAVTVDLVSEGYDLPDLEACIMLRPTMSESLFIQQVGRVMRPSEGKATCYLLDHVGNVGAMINGEFRRKHGLPDEVREWTLDGRVKRKGKKKDQEPEISVLQCPKCFMAHMPSPTCPGCGHVYEVKGREIEQVDGQLIKVDASMAAAMKVKQRRQVKNAKTFEELLKIEAERGYKPGWAKANFEAKQKTKAKYARRAGPPVPSREQLLQMSLDELLKVESEQGWPLGTAINFYNQHNNQQPAHGGH